MYTVAEMCVTLMRTSYALILYECHDFSCGFMIADGELAAMSEDFSGHVFTLSLGLTTVRRKFGSDIYWGDVLAVNDPKTRLARSVPTVMNTIKTGTR